MEFELTLEGSRVWKGRLEKGKFQVEDKQDQEMLKEVNISKVGE